MNKKELIIGMVVGILIVLGIFLALKPALVPTAGNTITQTGIVPSVSAEANAAVGPLNALTVAAALTQCNSRIISTASTSVMLSFKSSSTPSLTQGVWQAASTTKEYDNAQYGCTAITGVASASSTVHVVTTSI